HTLGVPLDPNEWLPRFEAFRTDDGMYVERAPSHHPWHTTAFAFGAMQLLGSVPDMPRPFEPFRDARRAVQFLDELDWTTGVSLASHEGAALCSMAALVPGFAAPA